MPTVQAEPQWSKSSFAGKYLGVLEEKQQSRSQPWALTARNTNGIVGCISECSQQAHGRDCSPLFGIHETAAGVRLHLEHHVQFWAPQCKKDTDTLEQVQV